MKLPETIRAAFVIARRDFTATVLSKTFLLFLLGPLFPALIGIMITGFGTQADRNARPATVAVIASQSDFDRLAKARDQLAPLADAQPFITLTRIAPGPDTAGQRDELLGNDSMPIIGVLEGGLAAPKFTGAVNADGRTIRELTLFIDQARSRVDTAPAGRPLEVKLTASSGGSISLAREKTAHIGQTLLFVLTVLLAGMLLSQLIEEKSNKVIEVLAAAVPVDAIFLGKLFAMLTVSLVGIMVWTGIGALAISLGAKGGLSALPAPAIGWPAFLPMVLLYFSMSYLLIGAVFLGIGAQASTVREVQTLSMPVTMSQVVIFGFASLGVGKPDSLIGISAAVFPLSSPFAMIARAAEQPLAWPHIVALLWQALWVALILKGASAIFRRSVLKSGRSRGKWWRRAEAVATQAP